MSRLIHVDKENGGSGALDPVCQAYADAVLGWPAFLEWQAAALEEPWVIPEDEV